MKGVRAFFKRMTGGRRPPTGPLTTAEANVAEELRLETSAKDDRRVDSGQAPHGQEPPAGSE